MFWIETHIKKILTDENPNIFFFPFKNKKKKNGGEVVTRLVSGRSFQECDRNPEPILFIFLFYLFILQTDQENTRIFHFEASCNPR